jgi:hypothetical protein
MDNDVTSIEVIGPGCGRCTVLDGLIRDTVASAASADYRYVTDSGEIVSRGFFRAPRPS